jgi:hypothetical protein
MKRKDIMYIPYNPCDECKHKKKLCTQCAFKNTEQNYAKALEAICRMSAELGREITILT